eukprot:1142985-Amphidinium_carterae.2
MPVPQRLRFSLIVYGAQRCTPRTSGSPNKMIMMALVVSLRKCPTGTKTHSDTHTSELAVLRLAAFHGAPKLVELGRLHTANGGGFPPPDFKLGALLAARARSQMRATAHKSGSSFNAANGTR